MSSSASRFDQLVQTLGSVAASHAPAAFSSSLSAEDMVVTHAILSAGLDIEIFTIDTGRLHADTLELIDRIRSRYGCEVRVYTPDAEAVAAYVASHGRDGIYESTKLRHECCRIRKVEPLARALRGKGAWVTGLRRETAPGRSLLPFQYYERAYKLLKVNPLVDWSEADVWDYLHTHAVPYNRLYNHGYRSIGCAPCTRPVSLGEDVRAGRWWWEEGAKECGLHVDARGRLVSDRVPA